MPSFVLSACNKIAMRFEMSTTLSNAIQRAVLASLADIDTKGDEGSLILEKLGPETRGIIALRIDPRRPDIDRFKQLNEQFDASF